MKRRIFAMWCASLLAATTFGLPQWALAADEAPDVFIKRLSDEVMGTIRSDDKIRAGDTSRVLALVNSKIMPNVDFARMTAATVGPRWRQATPEQKKRLQDEFKTLLVRTYSGALSQVEDQTISVKPLRANPEDPEVVVRTEIRGRGDPIQLDYRLEKTPGQGSGWKIYNLNVLGVWMVETYRNQFSEVANSKGVDGLITALEERNRSNETPAPPPGTPTRAAGNKKG
ncbi:MAG TPA: ABC transporter substrate-binding protein [Ramlibacter sp.]|jgi:phospholipid transport system substrate-binding protein|nr:ABC transporter substrate-binding protein [Ramlibacter sp.]